MEQHDTRVWRQTNNIKVTNRWKLSYVWDEVLRELVGVSPSHHVSVFSLCLRMNSILSSKPCCPTSGPSPTHGSTCRPARGSTSRSTRSACPRRRSAPWRTSCSARSPRSSRSGRRASWPNCARTSGPSSGRTLCSRWRGRRRRAACCPTPTRRARWGGSTACARQTKCGGWTWSWWFYSKGFPSKVLTGRGW